jgi:ABC-type multidrug transport system permease subunit
MSKWSIKFTKNITQDIAYFITKRLPTVLELDVNNLYNAIVEINSSIDYVGLNICIVKTNSGWYIMIKCDTEERFNKIYCNILAMYDHHKEVTEMLDKLKQSE